MIAATALVLMMTIPGLALFYCRHGAQEERARHHGAEPRLHRAVLGAVVRSATRLTFAGDGPLLGTSRARCSCAASAWSRSVALAKTIPEMPVHDLPDDLRDHHGRAGRRLGRGPHALLRLRVVRGALAARRLRADRALGLGRRLPRQAPACSTSPAAPWCISMPASPVWSPRCVLGKRHGYGTDNFAPFNLSLAVIGTGLLWVGWFGFNGGSALGANSRAAYRDRRHASRRLRPAR